MNLEVECYSGFKVNERPISFSIDDIRLMVDKIIDQWRTPECECFMVLADDGRVYVLNHDLKNDKWYMV